MPRVKIKQKEYNAKDLCVWVYARSKTLGFTLEEVARLLGITRQALYNKMKDGSAKFEYSEVMELFKVLGASDEEILKFMKC